MCGGVGSQTAHRTEELAMSKGWKLWLWDCSLEPAQQGRPGPRSREMGCFGPHLGRGPRVDRRVQEALWFPVSSELSDHVGYKDDFVGFLYVSPELQQG